MPRKFIPRVPCVCEVCGRAFEATQNDVRRGRGRRCSRACGLTKRHIPNRTCKHCGRAFFAGTSVVAYGGGVYCSNACRHRGRPPEPLWSRIWRRVDYGGPGCWEWTGQRSKDGYALISVPVNGGKYNNRHVTRVLWRLIHGEEPDICCHRCDNPPCVRPSHIFNGTQQENVADAWAKGRVIPHAAGTKGERVYGAKLTEAAVRAIRQRSAAGETDSALGRAYGVTSQTVHAVCTGKRWKHVT